MENLPRQLVIVILNFIAAGFFNREYNMFNLDDPSSTTPAWLAQSVERETLMCPPSYKTIDPSASQGCGFDPRIGLCFFLLFWFSF
jgi:hypothetical protein